MTLHKQPLQLICSVFDLLKGFALYYTVKLFLSGIKGILFSALEVTRVISVLS